jgi:hypothetical protein
MVPSLVQIRVIVGKIFPPARDPSPHEILHERGGF